MSGIDKLIEGLSILREHANAQEVSAVHECIYICHDNLVDPDGSVASKLKDLGFFIDHENGRYAIFI